MSARDVAAELAEALRAMCGEFDPYMATERATRVYVAARQALARFDAERAAVESRPASPARLCAICGEDAACEGCGGRCVRCARLSRECC